jgi:hypothetical protein
MFLENAGSVMKGLAPKVFMKFWDDFDM